MPTHAAQVSVPSTPAKPASRAPRAGRERNIVIQRDLARLRRGWTRSRRFWFWLALAAANFAFCFNRAFFVDGLSFVDGPDAGLYLYFTSFHLVLFFTIPFDALRKTSAARGEIEQLLVTPLPHRDIFWALWARSVAPGLALLLAFYLPLLFPYRWLRQSGFLEEGFPPAFGSGPFGVWELASELACDAAALSLFALPWIKGPAKRGISFAVAFFVLAGFAMAGMHNVGGWVYKAGAKLCGHEAETPNWILGVYASNARWHPLVTLPYLLITAAWGTGVGVWIALKRGLSTAGALGLILLLCAVPEQIAMHVTFLFLNPADFYENWSFLYVMLNFYTMGFGAFWLGLKWNLLVALSRRRIPTE